MALGRLAKHIITRDNERRSPLSAWMSRNYNSISDALLLVADKGGRRPWTTLAAIVSEAGVLNRDGSAVTGKTVRDAWIKLESRQPEKLPARRKAARAPPMVQPVGVVSEIPTEPLRTAPRSTPMPAEYVERPRTKFVSKGGARLRSLLPVSEREPRNE
jgi:hypothetical protein